MGLPQNMYPHSQFENIATLTLGQNLPMHRKSWFESPSTEYKIYQLSIINYQLSIINYKLIYNFNER